MVDRNHPAVVAARKALDNFDNCDGTDQADADAAALRLIANYRNLLAALDAAAAAVPEGGLRDSVLNSAKFRASCYALVGIVEGIEGLGRNWAANGERLKDTPEWVAFYNCVASMRNGTFDPASAEQTQQPAAAVPEVPAFTTGHCDYHKQAGGCPLHNLSCGWPKCDQRPNEAHRAMLAAANKEIPMNSEPPRFLDNGDGTVTLPALGLMFTKATITPEHVTHAQAEAACAELRTAGHDDWRLPTDHELFALVDRSRHNPAIDTTSFPDTKPNWYWTSTVCAWSSARAWFVSFSDGYCSYDNRDGDGGLVRAVRSVPAGQ